MISPGPVRLGNPLPLNLSPAPGCVPLGIKIVDKKIYVTCRDQLVKLHDLNGDEEIDYYESFNSDHQVTNHFHEFAMGLQTDKEGNFYYDEAENEKLLQDEY